jgi:hypothetical protein
MATDPIDGNLQQPVAEGWVWVEDPLGPSQLRDDIYVEPGR